MTKKEFKEFLLAKGFEDIGGDNDGQMYETEHVGVFVHRRGNSATLTFGHSNSGYYRISKPTFEQIISVIDIFKTAEFDGLDDKIPKKQFLLAIIDYLKRHIK